MKILFVLDHYAANNGVSVSGRRYARTLEERGHEVRFLSSSQIDDKSWQLEQFHLPIFDKLITAQGMVFAKTDERIIREAVEWADVVHCLMPFNSSIQAAKTAKALHKPLTAAFHVQPQNVSYSIGMGRWGFVNTFIYWYFRATFFRRVEHIHCPSNFIAGELKKHKYRAKLHVISNGVDPAFVGYRRLPKPAEWEGKFVILMIGRMSREKRQDVLIDAVKRSKYSKMIQLELAGQGPRKEKLLKRAKGLPNPIHIEFYDHAALRDLIAKCDLYVHTADAEIEAMSCMEAFASGRVPIIADSAQSATPQFALDGRSLFKAGDADALAQRIDYWIEHPEERDEMERKYCELGERYALDVCVTRFEEMLAEEMGAGQEAAV